MIPPDKDDTSWIEIEAQRIIASPKYRDLALSTVIDVIQQETGKHRRQSQALSAARRRLHRIAAIYLGMPQFLQAGDALRQAFANGDDQEIKTACEAVLHSHASTRERLPYMREIFDQLLRIAGTPDSLVDIACAVQPLAWRWTGLPRSCHYVALDINRCYVDLAKLYFELEGISHTTAWTDALVNPWPQASHWALLWKMFHCLENRRSGAGLLILERIPARFVAVSFPTVALSGRRIELLAQHGPAIERSAAKHAWQIHQFDVPGEYVLVIEKKESELTGTT